MRPAKRIRLNLVKERYSELTKLLADIETEVGAPAADFVKNIREVSEQIYQQSLKLNGATDRQYTTLCNFVLASNKWLLDK